MTKRTVTRMPDHVTKLKLTDVKYGDILIADSGFTCIAPGRECEVEQDTRGELFVSCTGPDQGYDTTQDYNEPHYLAGQVDKHGYLIGFKLKASD